MAALKTEVDAILDCDKCKQVKAVVTVELTLDLNGSIQSSINEIILPDGWVIGRTADSRKVYICPRCAAPKAIYPGSGW